MQRGECSPFKAKYPLSNYSLRTASFNDTLWRAYIKLIICPEYSPSFKVLPKFY